MAFKKQPGQPGGHAGQCQPGLAAAEQQRAGPQCHDQRDQHADVDQVLEPGVSQAFQPDAVLERKAAQLRRMSALTGNSQSSMISELLAQSSPVFDRLIAVLEAAEVAKTAAREDAAEKLKAAQSKIENQLGLMLDWMDDSSRPLLEHAEKVKRRTRRQAQEQPGTGDRATGGACAPTPLSNRGVRSDPKPLKTPLKTTTSARSLQKSEQAKKPAQKRAKKGAA